MRDEPKPKTSFEGRDRASTFRPTAQEGALSDYQGLYVQYEEAVARSNALTLEAEVARLEFDQVFDAVADAMLVLDLKGRVLRANAAALRLTGTADRAALLGASCRDVLQGELCGGPRCILERIRKGGGRVREEVLRRVGAREAVPLRLAATPLLGLSFELAGVVVQFTDITEQRRQEVLLKETNAELNRLVSIDSLTRVANRRAFDAALERELRRMRRKRQPLSLILCDVDQFKRYNDHYGHPAGDRCLQLVAGCIRRCARRPGDLVARFGGEEFVVILADTPEAGALHVAEAIRQAVEETALPHAESTVAEVVTLSIGAATMMPADCNGPGDDRLLSMADAALYRAKAAGRNQVAAAPSA